MAAFFLEGEHAVCQLLGFHRSPLVFLAELVVLTVEATKVASGKKDGSGAVFAGYRGFFAVMGEIAAYHGQPSGTAEPLFAAESV